MIDLNTKKDFEDYCYNNWLKRKDIKLFLKLLKEFIIDSMVNKWKFVLTGIFTIYTTTTKTTLKEWVFKKVKIKLTDNISYLFKKW